MHRREVSWTDLRGLKNMVLIQPGEGYDQLLMSFKCPQPPFCHGQYKMETRTGTEADANNCFIR